MLKAQVADSQVDDLRARIEHSRHVLVAAHHHLFEVNCPWLDRDRIQSATLLECLTKHSAVRGFVCGHVHQESENERDGRQFLSTPSTCFQFEPGSQAVTLNQQSPGWRQLQLFDDGHIESEVHRVQGLSLNPVFPESQS